MATRALPGTTAARHRIFLVEDHPITREGLRQLINYQGDLMVCGQASTAAEAMEGIRLARTDLVIIDIVLAGGSGIELIKDLRAQKLRLPILVLSTHDEALYADRALRAGAQGYVMKQAPTREVINAIRHVLRGEVYLSEAMRGRVLRKFAGSRVNVVGTDPVADLSDRELEIFRLLGEGRGTAEIAQRLHLSVSTVETHRAHIKEKLGLRTAMELVHRAVEWANRER